MSVNTVTYDQVPPIRPGVDDLGGAAKQNATRAPDPVRSATAEDFNQISKQLVEHAAAIPVAVISLKITAGVPAIDFCTGSGSAAKIPGTYTVVDNGVGDTSVTWPVGTFPGTIARHKAGITGATVGFIACESISNGIRVRTKDTGAAAADLTWTADIYGQ